MDWKTFRNHAIELGYRLRKDDVERLARFYTLLEDGNQRAALTAITDLSGYLERHVLDALTVSCALNSTEPPRRILDVGAGAGIPAIPLAIALPRHAHYEESPGAPPHVYALESVGKKTAFMESCKVPLGLVDTFSVLDGRAEEAARDLELRDSFDLVVARAVASLPLLLELTLPFVRVDGLLIAWKGPRAQTELQAAERALQELNACVDKVVPVLGQADSLQLVRIRKHAPTPPRYPRRTGIPRKRPL